MSNKKKNKGTKEDAKPALVPKLRFREFRRPWDEKTLESLGYFTGGGTPRKDHSAYWTGEIPWISSSDLVEDSISQINISRFITELAVQESATKFVPAKSILLISRVGVGKLAVSTFPLCTSQDFTNFTPTAADPFFLAYLLKSRKETFLSFNQGTSIKGFTKDNIASLLLPFPSPAEQRKIAECLSSVDELIAVQARKVDALNTHKNGLMQLIFPCEGETQPRLRFPEFQNDGEWEECAVEDVIVTVTPPKKLQTSDYRTKGRFPIVDQSQDNICGWTDDGAAVIDEGLPVIVFGDHTCALKFVDHPFVQGADGIKILRPKCGIDVKFLFCALEADLVVQESYKRHFSMLKEKRIRFPDPKSNEQHCIASCLIWLDGLIAAETQKYEALKHHKRGLMQQLFPSPEESEA